MTMEVDFVFLHGGGQGSWCWDDTLAAMTLQAKAEIGRTVALDVPGCGRKRERSTKDLSMESVVEELLADINAAGVKDVVLVGHSQGGQAMSLMAAMEPALFQRLIYVSCSLPKPGQTVLQMIGNGVRGADPEEVGWPADPATTSMDDLYELMFCNDMTADQAKDFLSKLGPDQWPRATYRYTDWRTGHLGTVPSSYVRCLGDNILPLAWQDIFAARFKTERTVTVDAGHQAMNTRPQALAEALLREARAEAVVGAPKFS